VQLFRDRGQLNFSDERHIPHLLAPTDMRYFTRPKKRSTAEENRRAEVQLLDPEVAHIIKM
jgi:hypothetical protein